MKKIYKYVVTEGSELELPEEFKIIHFAKVVGVPLIWVEVRGENTELYHVTKLGTGWSFPKGNIHIYTEFDGPFVWHYYLGKI